MDIWIWVTVGVAFLLLIFLSVGLSRFNIPRKASFEGIEDDELIRAYDRISRWPQFKLLRWLIINELKSYHPNGILADIGCGPGYLISNMAKSLPHLSIIGVDISQDMVKKAAQNLSSLGFSEKVSFRQGDIQRLPFETNTMDFAISTLSLHHWSDPKQSIQEIYRVLKPGGQFLIFDLRRNSPKLLYWLILFAQTFVLPSVMKKVNEPTNSLLSSYKYNELEAFLSKTSFRQWKIKPGFGWVFVWGYKD